MSESGVGAAILQRNLRPGVYWGETEDTYPDLLLDGSTFLDGGKARLERGRVPHP
jgi:hypothetical protein